MFRPKQRPVMGMASLILLGNFNTSDNIVIYSDETDPVLKLRWSRDLEVSKQPIPVKNIKESRNSHFEMP